MLVSCLLIPLQSCLDDGGKVIGTEKIMKKSLWGYRGEDDVPFLKITLAEPRSVPKIRDKCS